MEEFIKTEEKVETPKPKKTPAKKPKKPPVRKEVSVTEPVKKKGPETVRIYIPKEPGTKVYEVGYNGKFYRYQRGTYRDVPAEVAKIIQRSVEASEGPGAFDRFRIDVRNQMGAHLNF
jgi:hypothetical protein